MMYKCYNCDKEFEEPRQVRTTYEAYYGVYGVFPNHTPLSLNVCPYCGDEDIEEVIEDD